ncbi:Hypothetical protein FKW44_019961 [Caligus rogercresseyi]|uniref:Uncharacterized protein n=1 Tax=Caligus rogercresseyi TaxID=217165 RepID=A0A7T8GX40_CALRO|nr:Hypothetical protein FKW44_019961 [Caligus rogercresseyi]
MGNKKAISHVFRDCTEINRLWERVDKTFEERVGRQSTREEKLNVLRRKF